VLRLAALTASILLATGCQLTPIFGISPPPPPTGPAGIVDNCSVDVTSRLQGYLNALAPNATWTPPPGACYLVNEGLQLGNLPGLTINGNGATFESLNSVPFPRLPGHPIQDGPATFTAEGGSNITLKDLTILGADTSDSYVWNLVGEAGIMLRGTQNVAISHVTTSHTFGDGLIIEPQLAPYPYRLATGLSVNDVTVDGAGRQGITPAGLIGGTFTDITTEKTADRSWDFEADGSWDYAENITVTGCTYDQGISFAMPGANLGPITFRDCSSTAPGSAPTVTGSSEPQAGPIEYLGGSFMCHNRSPAESFSCVGDNGGSMLIAGATVHYPDVPGYPTIDHVYEARNGAQLAFFGDDVSGFAPPVGTVLDTSKVTVLGGTWTPAS
jgi:hypothetical protein